MAQALAGIIIASLGAATAFWLNGLSFVAVIISLWLVTSNQVRKPLAGNFLTEFKEGISYVATQPRLQDLIILAILTTFFAFPVIMSLLPAVVGKVLQGDAATLSWLMMSSGVGALMGTMVLAPLTQATRRTGMVLGGIIGWTGLWLVLFAQGRLAAPLNGEPLFCERRDSGSINHYDGVDASSGPTRDAGAFDESLFYPQLWHAAGRLFPGWLHRRYLDYAAGHPD